jgi:hypothetical protein
MKSKEEINTCLWDVSSWARVAHEIPKQWFPTYNDDSTVCLIHVTKPSGLQIQDETNVTRVQIRDETYVTHITKLFYRYESRWDKCNQTFCFIDTSRDEINVTRVTKPSGLQIRDETNVTHVTKLFYRYESRWGKCDTCNQTFCFIDTNRDETNIIKPSVLQIRVETRPMWSRY